MMTMKHIWIGLVILCLVVVLTILFATHWQHVTGMSTIHLLLADANGIITHGC